MAVNLYAGHARGLRMFQGLQGTTCPQFQWNSQTFNISPSSIVTKQPLVAGGWNQDFDLKFSFLTYQITNATAQTTEQLRAQMLNTPMVYLGANYKIEKITIAPNGLVFVIEANALDQNA